MELFNYLLKVSACLTLFFALYLVVLRKLTFFKANRFYLLLSLIGSFVIPNLQFTVEQEVQQMPIENQTLFTEQIQLTDSNDFVPLIAMESEPVETIDWLGLLPLFYGAVVITLLSIACWRIWQLLEHTKNDPQLIGGLKLVSKTQGFTNCSFFSYVFIDDANLTPTELEILLKHEMVHAKQYHSLDKLMMVFAKAILWFNPIIYLYDKALEQNHEYEADAATSLDYGTNPYAQLLLRLAVSKNKLALVHNFVKSPIKERIKMLFHDKSKAMKKFMYLLVLPIGLGLIWGFTIDIVEVFPKANILQETQNEPFVVVVDAGHGGKNAGAQVNGFAEKNITLSMARKIKALAEAKGIKVLLTRSGDEYVSLGDRLNLNGNLLLSLHVNSAPSNLKNGVEMFTPSNPNPKDLRFARSNGLTYHLYKNLKNAKGIKINNTPQKQRVAILNSSSMPAVQLELGYLSNKKDFQYITNNQKQDELAKLIVDAIVDYQQKTPSNEEQVKFQKFADDFHAKYATWKKSEKYKSLIGETKNFKPQTLTGSIQSLNYFQRGKVQDMDGFILNANNKLYRIFLDKEQLKSTSFKVGDQVSLLAPKAEVWFDSDYPVVKPKELSITPSTTTVSALPFKWSAFESSTINRKRGTLLLKKGRIELESVVLVGDEITYDKTTGKITVKNGSIQYSSGYHKNVGHMVYDLNNNTFKIDDEKGVVSPKTSPAYHLLSNLKINSDSVKVRTFRDDVLFLTGKVKFNFDEFRITGKLVRADMNSSRLISYYGTLTAPDGKFYESEVITIDVITKKVTTASYTDFSEQERLVASAKP